MSLRILPLTFAILVICGSLFAQQSLQRGRIKNFDAQQGVVTIATPDGADVEASIVPQTMFRDANNQDIAGAREKGIPAGTTVMFRAEERGGKMVLVGMRLPGDGGGKQKAGGQAKAGGQKGNFASPPPPRDSIGVKPLTELGNEQYKGESGGLYGNGNNDPPAPQQEAAKKAVAKIQPLDAQGKPSPTGKIGLVSICLLYTSPSPRDS